MLNTSSVVHKEFYSLEKHFEAVCNLHPHLKLLESQWRFDQELISKALQNIGSIFPHYSRHDASHSRQIIVNIERILGDKIQYLTATDTWLILESAYNHDIGMVITQKQIEDMNTADFHNFVVELKDDTGHYLHQFAKNWLEDKAILPKQAPAHDFFQNYLQLLAEWYRQKHPHNSARIIRSPVEEIGLNSPRNELLPKRLFSVLADICESHGRSFNELMEQLPQAEAGMASEDCHPRYVACLLRMGDLLDVDDNRFCPVMMAMCGHNMPKLSKTHYDKHQAIKHLRMDAERIEIKCVCPTPDSYEEAYSWFDWLQQEYHKQTQHWHKIVPSSELGRLPTLMTPLVEMDEPYIVLDEGKKPTLKVNKDSFLTLVRGTGLYNSKFNAIREILQNAVDSTLHRVWIEHKDEDKDEFKKDYKIKDPTSPKLLEIYDKYLIDISFEPHKDKKGTWILKVKDQGIGISFNDLKYMLEVGSSAKNKEKAKRTAGMPMWFRPSGAFGIGLQSGFLLSDQFTLITYSLIDQQKLKITFNKEKNNVLLEKLSSKKMKYGTEFIIEIKIDEIPRSLSHSFNNDEELNNIYLNFDIMEPDLSSVEIFNIKQNIAEFFQNTGIQSNKTKKNKIIQESYFDSDEQVIINNVEFGDFDGHHNINFFFRGQYFRDLSRKFPCMSFHMDFYHTTSDQFLTYNRDKIKPEVNDETYEKVIRTLRKYIENKFDDFNETNQIYAAFSYILNLSDKKYDDIPFKFKEKALLFPVHIDDETIFLKDLIEKIKSEIFSEISVECKSVQYSSESKKIDKYIKNNISERLFHFIKFILTKDNLYYSEVNYHPNYKTIKISKEDIQPVSNQKFKEIIYQKDGSNLSYIGCRKVFPAWKNYRKLAVNKDFSWVDLYPHES
ncbi:HD domain-containing protein [Acinetobacter lwoffii]